MRQLVRLRKKPSRDGSSFKYFIDYSDENGKRRRISLEHANRRKAERQRDQKERELRMGFIEPDSMKLSEFLEDCNRRTSGQVRESTLRENRITMKDFINCVGNIDFQNVQFQHGESFLQFCRDKGNAPATAAKKLRHLKRMFQLAVERRQLEENPLKWVKQPKSPKRKVQTYGCQECERLLRAAAQYTQESASVNWKILVLMELCTGMRRGELLNVTWMDIDFEHKTVEVAPKKHSESTWEWHVKDTERRTLPLTEEVLSLLATHQAEQAEGLPYVFVPADRYEHIKGLMSKGQWTVEMGKCPINNFTRHFHSILKMAGMGPREFHDLRRTYLSNLLASGLGEFEVMNLAGHSSFETTRSFYLAVRGDLIARAREASEEFLKFDFGTHLARTPLEGQKQKRLPNTIC